MAVEGLKIPAPFLHALISSVTSGNAQKQKMLTSLQKRLFA